MSCVHALRPAKGSACTQHQGTIARNGFAARVKQKMEQVAQSKVDNELSKVYAEADYFDPRNYVAENVSGCCPVPEQLPQSLTFWGR